MSKLASKIAATPISALGVRRGPANSCFPIYGAGDAEDFEAVEGLRADGLTWREVQDHIDALVGAEKPLPIDKFRYHWRKRCYCWPEGLRR